MLSKNKNIIVEQLENEYVLFDAEENALFILNQTAYELWTRCENRSKSMIVKDFMESLDHDSVESIGATAIQAECDSMINDFWEKGLIK